MKWVTTFPTSLTIYIYIFILAISSEVSNAKIIEKMGVTEVRNNVASFTQHPQTKNDETRASVSISIGRRADPLVGTVTLWIASIASWSPLSLSLSFPPPSLFSYLLFFHPLVQNDTWAYRTACGHTKLCHQLIDLGIGTSTTNIA